MSGLAHGPRKPKSLFPILDLHVEELHLLWIGLRVVHPSYTHLVYQLRAALFLTVADYPGYEDMLNQTGAGSYNACMQCNQQGVHHGSMSRMAYGEYRRYLADDDPLRSDEETFGSVEVRGPPARKTKDLLLQWYEAAENFAGVPNLPEEQTGVRAGGLCPLLKAPGGTGPDGKFDSTTNSPKDLPHVSKDIFQHLQDCFKGKRVAGEGKRKKPKPLPIRMKEYSERTLAVQADRERLYKEQEEKRAALNAKINMFKIAILFQRLADQRYSNIKGPAGFVRVGVFPFRRTGSFTMHDAQLWFTTGIGKLVLSPPVLGKKTHKVVCDLFDVMADMFCVTPTPDQVRQCGVRLAQALAKFENHFPETEHAIVFHLLLEIQKSIELLGPPDTFWMYVFERFVGRLSRKIKDRGHPNKNLLNMYCLEAGVKHLADSLRASLVSAVGPDVVRSLLGKMSWGAVAPQRPDLRDVSTSKLGARHRSMLSDAEAELLTDLVGGPLAQECKRITKGFVHVGVHKYSPAYSLQNNVAHNLCYTPDGLFGEISSIICIGDHVIAMVCARPIHIADNMEYVWAGESEVACYHVADVRPAAFGWRRFKKGTNVGPKGRRWVLRPTHGVYKQNPSEY
jgi:hypothetical protein